jgi:hypothetical protein
MREDLDKKLCEKYPEIFKNRNAPKTQTAMCWGFECGDGWYDLIDVLCHNIQHHINWKNQFPEEKIDQVVASQVKEKFGGLRFYTDYYSDDIISGMIAMAESMSYRICEECGDRGKMRGGGWVRTLCDKHAAKYDYMDTEETP